MQKTDIAGERNGERDRGSEKATRNQASALVKEEKVTSARRSVCVCVRDRNSYWQEEGSERDRKDLCQNGI